MQDRFEIRLGGSGGQGLVLAGIILAEAAGIYQGKNVVQTVSYGPAARGGTSRADVIISEGDIDFPKALDIDILLAMTQGAADESVSELKPAGLLVVDAQLVPQVTFPRVVKIPLTKIAREKCGREQMANIVGLGALTRLIPAVRGGEGMITPETMEAAIMDRIPKGTEKLNKLAFEEGMKAAEEIQKTLVFIERPEDADQV